MCKGDIMNKCYHIIIELPNDEKYSYNYSKVTHTVNVVKAIGDTLVSFLKSQYSEVTYRVECDVVHYDLTYYIKAVGYLG
jgi:hypothetical protein